MFYLRQTGLALKSTQKQLRMHAFKVRLFQIFQTSTVSSLIICSVIRRELISIHFSFHPLRPLHLRKGPSAPHMPQARHLCHSLEVMLVQGL